MTNEGYNRGSTTERLSKEYAQLLRKSYLKFCEDSKADISFIQFTRLLYHSKDIPTKLNKKRSEYDFRLI